VRKILTEVRGQYVRSATETGKVVLRKGRRLLDQPYSSIQVRRARVSLSEAPTYRERVVLREYHPLLRQPEMVVYDIGANAGTFASAFAKVSNVSRVIAFEPLPDVFDVLAERVKSMPKVTCFNVALGDRPGLAPFYRSEFSPASSLLPMDQLHKSLFPFSANCEETNVQVVRLDDFAEEQNIPAPDLIKMDVQGFEDRVLRGGEKTVRRAGHCVLEVSFVSLYERSPLFDDVRNQMETLDFRFVGYLDQVVGSDGQRIVADAIFQSERMVSG
jgi:FkbM family methyltransferase